LDVNIIPVYTHKRVKCKRQVQNFFCNKKRINAQKDLDVLITNDSKFSTVQQHAVKHRKFW